MSLDTDRLNDELAAWGRAQCHVAQAVKTVVG